MRNANRQVLRTLVREARRVSTPAEKELWERLRDHRCGGLHFRRQEIVGPFRLDFYCCKTQLAVEVDGGIHNTESVRRRDTDRQRVLEQEFGICVLRVTNEDVRHQLDAVVTRILTLANHLLNSPLSHEAEEGSAGTAGGRGFPL